MSLFLCVRRIWSEDLDDGLVRLHGSFESKRSFRCFDDD